MPFFAMRGLQVIWFKRDLRITDHAPLFQAAQQGPVLPLYIFEPDLWKQPDLSGRHFQFLQECLLSLEKALQKHGLTLTYRTGSVVDVLDKLHTTFGIENLWSHQETWNGWTYKRDRTVKAWCQSKQIKWHEPLQHGVIRRLKSRDGWANRWTQIMHQPLHTMPTSIVNAEAPQEKRPTEKGLGIKADSCPERQKGGRGAAEKTLYSFLEARGVGYQKEMSSPVSAFDACSRLSPYLAFGVLSVREVYLAAEQRKKRNAPASSI